MTAQRKWLELGSLSQRYALALGISGQAPQTYGLLKRLAYPETLRLIVRLARRAKLQAYSPLPY
jgi:hypothetical protein